MTDNPDKRIQLRENIHQLVVSASNRRGSTPASFVSHVIYEYLRNCGELELSSNPPVTTVIPPARPKPRTLAEENARLDVIAAEQEAMGNVWRNGEWVPSEDLRAIVEDWEDDE